MRNTWGRPFGAFGDPFLWRPGGTWIMTRIRPAYPFEAAQGRCLRYSPDCINGGEKLQVWPVYPEKIFYPEKTF